MTEAVQKPANAIVGVRFRHAGKVSYFDANDLELHPVDDVIVETEKGMEIGRVVLGPEQVVHSEVTKPLRKVLRRATEADYRRRSEMEKRAGETLVLAQDSARMLELPMKFLEAQYTLDGGRVILQFHAEERVDFRPLLRKLGETLRVRVELRQVGPRDEAKLLGGIGRCGRVLCCTTWLAEFCPITVRMAKEQALPISAEHLAGQCGRLKCCLRYEYEQYIALNRALPRIGEKVDTPYGLAKVIVGHPLKEMVSVLLESEATAELRVSQITRRQDRQT